MASSLVQRARKDRKFLKRALANPGTRSKLPASMLRPGQRAQRQRNTAAAKTHAAAKAKRQAANAPVVPGGTLTERQLGKTSNVEANVKYAPLEAQQQRQVGEAQTWQHDIGGYYDQYLDQIAKQSANVRAIGNEANTALSGLQAGVTGLAGADLKQQQGAANQDAAQRGATAGDNTQLASNAAATRQALLGSFAAQQVAQNSAATRYADMLALNVAPAQKLQAVAMAGGRVRQAREKQADTAREKGAFKLSTRESLRSDEAKNVLAREIATGKSAVDLAQLGETKRSHKANERAAQDRIAAGRESAADRKAIAEGKINAYGYTDKAWKAMSTAERRKIIAAKAGGKGSSKGGGLDLQTGGQRGSAMTQLSSLKTLAQKAKAGDKFEPTGKENGPGKALGRHGAAVKILGYSQKIKDPVLVSAALDAVYAGYIGSTTVQRLHKAGYRVDEVSAALGVPTKRGTTKGRPKYKPVQGQ